jgi:hypothetical protein
MADLMAEHPEGMTTARLPEYAASAFMMSRRTENDMRQLFRGTSAARGDGNLPAARMSYD